MFHFPLERGGSLPDRRDLEAAELLMVRAVAVGHPQALQPPEGLAAIEGGSGGLAAGCLPERACVTGRLSAGETRMKGSGEVPPLAFVSLTLLTDV